MTLLEACSWSLIRSLALALLAGPICWAMSLWLQSLPDRRRVWAWWALWLPFLCPELWAGYAWSGSALRLTSAGFWTWLAPHWSPAPLQVLLRDAAVQEAVLDVLLLARMVPAGTLMLYISPLPALSHEALYCWQLLNRPWRQTLRLQLERLTALWPALGLMFLVAFQEFELASLIGRPAWTVWLFDAQVGGLALADSLWRAWLPVSCQISVLAPLAWWVLRRRPAAPVRVAAAARPSRHAGRLAGLVLGGSAGVLLVAPLLLVGSELGSGVSRVLQNGPQTRMLFRELGYGLAYSLTAAIVCSLVAASLLRAARHSAWGRAAVALAVLPGFGGSLVLGLALIQFWLLPGFRLAYKSPASLESGLVLMLLPRALLVRCLLRRAARPAGVYLACLLQGSADGLSRELAGELLWHLRWRGEFWSVAVLTYWGFFDLTLASLLAPVTIVSAPVMLYNQMHFGRNATLTALVLITAVVPISVFLLAAGLRRPVFRWLWR